jgi:hypothetical protein
MTLVEHGELEVRVPLDRQLVMRDALEDGGELVDHPLLVERFDPRLVLRGDEGGDRGQRVGRETWNRQSGEMCPSRLRRANVRYDEIAASA